MELYGNDMELYENDMKLYENRYLMEISNKGKIHQINIELFGKNM